MLRSVAHTKGHVQLHYACQLAHDIALPFDSCTIMCEDLQQQTGSISSTELMSTVLKTCWQGVEQCFHAQRRAQSDLQA